MKIVFTICSNNYLAQAKTLGDTLFEHNSEYLFLIGLCDKEDVKIDYSFFSPYKIIKVDDIGIRNFEGMSEVYNIVELNTAVKPFFFDYLFRKYNNVESILYLDPDIAVFNSLKFIEDEFNNGSILLTPHIYTPIEFDGKFPTENIFTNYGIYNLGFIGLKRDGEVSELLSWWKRRLEINCYEKVSEGIFVDQLPINFAPIFFNNVVILKNFGLNVAPWNLHERVLGKNKDLYFINNKYPLIFYHFSNYNPLIPDILANHYNRISFKDNIELKNLYDDYREKLLKNRFLFYNKIDCYYNKNGIHRVPEICLVQSDLDDTRLKLQESKLSLEIINSTLKATNLELEESIKFGLELSLDLQRVKSNLDLMQSSREWRTILKLQKLFKLIFPANSLRRKILVKLFRFSKKITKIIFKIKREIFEISLKSKNCLIKFRPRKRRKINLKSKRLVYIGHSYHNKTKSTAFLIDYLKKFFDVEVLSDESWQGKPAPDLSFIDESYLGVIFFQLLPSREIIDKIKNDNIIYFPMYDQSGRLGYDYWKNYRGLKVANFSSTLHKKLKKWNFESMYVQYFLNPQEFKPGKKDEVFFWQRLTNINISKIIKLFGKKDLKIHIHKAIDPNQEFMQPSKRDEDRFKITYSEWFDTREEMLEVVNQKGIYIAPREYEGIGLSFLEAMAKGKAVIAVDNPTMNEYIEHGKTGYLYDLNNPKKIDLSDIEEVQKNTYKYMQDGYRKWKEDRKRIINFIKQA